MDFHKKLVLLSLIVSSISPEIYAWGWFSSSASVEPEVANQITGNSLAEFSMEGLNDEKGTKLVEKARSKMVGMNLCWHSAYGNLFNGCKDMVATDEKRKRFAWHLSDCFQRETGRPNFPFCDSNSAMISCLKKLNELEHKVYLEFMLETNSICHQLQNYAFKYQVERLVNELRGSAHYAEERLVNIEQKTTSLLQNSDRIHDSLGEIDNRIHNVDVTTHKLGENMGSLVQHSQMIHEQEEEIVASQLDLRDGQAKMNEKLKEGLGVINKAYKNLGEEVMNLRTEAAVIEQEINKVGDTMSTRMNSLQKTADEIGNIAGTSLDNQQQLLKGQTMALEGLQSLTRSQYEALEESRNTVQRLAEYGQTQQEELREGQERLQHVHDRLFDNFKSIAAAQEAFESKQASMFVALDKLFALHNAMLVESRIIKAFFIYFLSVFVIYMFTSTKQTYDIRPRLYIGLCIKLAVEVAILRLTNDLEQQTSFINVARLLFILVASVQILHAIFTYRDYEVLNHQMLLTLMEKVSNIQSHRELDWEAESDGVDWPSWMVAELPEDVDKLVDPDFHIPEEVAENSVTCTSLTRRYALRPRGL